MKISFDNLVEDFALLEDWEERYRYIIDIGKNLSPLAPQDQTADNLVKGCASQVWLVHKVLPNGALHFDADSDAFIVKGLVSIVLMIFNDKNPQQIIETDATEHLKILGLNEHLSSQRANGINSMVQKIKAIAKSQIN